MLNHTTTISNAAPEAAKKVGDKYAAQQIINNTNPSYLASPFGMWNAGMVNGASVSNESSDMCRATRDVRYYWGPGGNHIKPPS